MIHATGEWAVKEGRTAEFERARQGLANQVSLAQPEIVIRLLRDVENPRRLVRISGPWRSPDELQALLNSELFQGARAAMRRCSTVSRSRTTSW